MEKMRHGQRVTDRDNSVAGSCEGFANLENAFADPGKGVADCGKGVAERRIGFAQISQAFAGCGG